MSDDGALEDDVVQIHNEYYIRATSSRADDRTRVLKDEDMFGVFDRFGDVQVVGMGEQGVYFQGTRFLSRLELRLGGRRPLPLSSNVREGNDLVTVDLTNPDLTSHGDVRIPRGAIHIARSKILWEDAYHERIAISNYGLEPIRTDLMLRLECDFLDIFEVRGSTRKRRGTRHPGVWDGNTLRVAYDGLDGVRRQATVKVSVLPASIAAEMSAHLVRFEVALVPRAQVELDLTMLCEVAPGPKRAPATFEQARDGLRAKVARHRDASCRVQTSNQHMNRWIERSSDDLLMMTTTTRDGPYPYAGVPWFSTVFGRDGILTALECLWFDPTLAAGVLRTLGALQADEVAPERDAQPGKILHERRDGEMAALGEVPFGMYYGSVDASPLYVWLAGEYVERTGDVAAASWLWPHVKRALNWIDRDGDRDGDGFVEYARSTPAGLEQQGWKDSHDSVFHEDGRLAEGPIALCEVQAYVFAAKKAAARLALLVGDDDEAASLRTQADILKRRFDEAFWDDKMGTYVLALDGGKRPCRVRTSNAGHALAAGIAPPEHARRCAESLLARDMFSGWGVRTLSTGEFRYNPMSYHNGSVWPHDNALIAAGLSRYGFADLASTLMTGLFEASTFFDLHRLPELFCGFPARVGEGPTLYPIACSPQAWAAAAVFMLLGSCLGMQIRGREDLITFRCPSLPRFMETLRILALRTGPSSSVDLYLDRHPHDVGVSVVARRGPVRIVVER